MSSINDIKFNPVNDLAKEWRFIPLTMEIIDRVETECPGVIKKVDIEAVAYAGSALAIRWSSKSDGYIRFTWYAALRAGFGSFHEEDSMEASQDIINSIKNL